MAHKRDTSPANPLKDQNQSKRTTQEQADQGPAGPGRGAHSGGPDNQRRRESPEHADQGATSRDAAVGPWATRNQQEAQNDTPSPGASSAHPSQHGGIRAADAQADPLSDDSAGNKRGPSPADEPSSDRTGTAPHRGASSGRTGKTDEDRHRPRD